MYTIVFKCLREDKVVPKTVPLSVRISHDDAAFLAELKIEGATTPSDKLRGLIAERKKQSLQGDEYDLILASLEANLGRVIPVLRHVENDQNAHSEILKMVAESLPDMLAHLLAQGRKVKDKNDMAKLESQIADKFFLLIEMMLRLGVTSQSPCIDKEAISKRIGTSVELVQMIKSRLEK